MIYQYLCERCHKEFEEVRSFEDRNNVFCCGHRATKLICSNPTVFNDTKYIFTAKPGQFGKKGAEVSGRSDFKRLLEKEGLADASVKECLQHASYRKREIVKENTYKRKSVMKKVRQRINQEGISSAVPHFAKDVLKMKVKT